MALRRVPSKLAIGQPEPERAAGVLLIVPYATMAALFGWPLLIWGWGAWWVTLELMFWFRRLCLFGQRRMQQLREARHGESICTFARSFARREVDTRVIRAVWEELHPGFPLRAEDSLAADLWIDDVDMGTVWPRLAARAGRTLDDCETNPWCRRIERVADVVHFLAAQPRAA